MDGKAKIWYETYRLRQVVGDWSEFMESVELHFGAADLPPLTPILGSAQPSLNVYASEDISCSTPCLNESQQEVMDKAAEPMKPTLAQLTERLKLQSAQLQMAVDKLATVTRMAETVAASDEEVLTNVAGVSLFREPCIEPAEVVLSELHRMEFKDDVFTTVGGLSLFLELVLEPTDGISEASNFKDVMCKEDPPDEAEHKGTYMQHLFWSDASLGDIDHMAEPLAKEYSHDVLTHSGNSSLFLEQVIDAANKAFDGVLLDNVSRSDEAVSPYNFSTFDPGIVTSSVEGWVLELLSPLQCHGFSPGSQIAKSEHMLYGSLRDPLCVLSDPRVLDIILCDTSVWKSTSYVTNQWDPGISPGILEVHSLGNLQLFDYAVRSGLRESVLLFKFVTDGIRLSLPWYPGLLPGIFDLHLLLTLKSALVLQHYCKVNLTDCLLMRCCESCTMMFCLYIQCYRQTYSKGEGIRAKVKSFTVSAVISEMYKLGRTKDIHILKFRAQLLASADLQTKNRIISQLWCILDSTTSQTWMCFLLHLHVMQVATRNCHPGYPFLESLLIQV